jgi:hypothetical protein
MFYIMFSYDQLGEIVARPGQRSFLSDWCEGDPARPDVEPPVETEGAEQEL